MFEGSHRFA